MKKILFPYRIFFALLLAGTLATFLTANSISVTKHIVLPEMITPFPVVLELGDQVLQVVSKKQLQKLKLPDPETNKTMEPSFLLSDGLFTNGIMPPQAILGKSISNGNGIFIPTDYSAQVSAKIIDSTSQEITIIYTDKATEDHLITAIYTAKTDHYIPKVQYVKNVLIWKTIFMNGMMLSLIISFIICKIIAKKNRQKLESTP